ncbi:MAG: ABC transporter ATP-binding protein [Spirochaetales bacterium]|nr:ABC transporter ATP-binding protein [Spirochaetales bacterium]
MKEYNLIADNLSYSYGKLKAVDGISFSLLPGEILGFLGPNGAGKTTTWKMLTGQMRPQGGTINILGKEIVKNTKEIQKYIGVCFEYTNLYEQMSARENLKFFSRLFGIRNYDVEALLRRIGFEDKGDMKIEQYSKGMKQRIMVARSIINEPKILFLDEPTSGLDPVSSDDIRRIIREEQQRGATIFLTTHDMMEADKLCDRVAFINQGKITALDTPHNLKQSYGQRMLKARVAENGAFKDIEIPMDTPETPDLAKKLFAENKIITLHSAEATLEDIFIKINGRGLGT